MMTGPDMSAAFPECNVISPPHNRDRDPAAPAAQRNISTGTVTVRMVAVVVLPMMNRRMRE